MRYAPHISATLGFFLAPVGAHAASTCTFTTECYVNEACQETRFTTHLSDGPQDITYLGTCEVGK